MVNVDELIANEKKQSEAKATAIAALLKERTDLDAATEKRQDEIAAALKALGYKRPRATPQTKEKVA